MDGRDWKDEWLIFCLYLHAGWTMGQIAAILQIGAQSTISSIVRQWALFLNEALGRAMPNPSKAEILRRYPTRFVEEFGHARMTMLLDATDIEMEVSSSGSAQSATYSTCVHSKRLCCARGACFTPQSRAD